MRPIGLHLRLNSCILDAATQAVQMETPIFQCFLTNQANKNHIHPTSKALSMLSPLREKIETIYIHGSYWINLANLRKYGLKIFNKEIDLAHQIGSIHFILHPGAAPRLRNHAQRIDALAKTVNTLTHEPNGVTIVLENTAHGNASVGSDLQDFYELRQKLDHPDRIAYCVDTAHAHSYGYNLVDKKTRNDFIELIDQAMGIENVVLIHLNDAVHERGSLIDKHASIGEGLIGTDPLKAFALDARLQSIPIILELPILPHEQELAILQEIRTWHR